MSFPSGPARYRPADWPGAPFDRHPAPVWPSLETAFDFFLPRRPIAMEIAQERQRLLIAPVINQRLPRRPRSIRWWAPRPPRESPLVNDIADGGARHLRAINQTQQDHAPPNHRPSGASEIVLQCRTSSGSSLNRPKARPVSAKNISALAGMCILKSTHEWTNSATQAAKPVATSTRSCQRWSTPRGTKKFQRDRRDEKHRHAKTDASRNHPGN